MNIDMNISFTHYPLTLVGAEESPARDLCANTNIATTISMSQPSIGAESVNIP